MLTNSQRVEFPAAHGGKLAARLDLPVGPPTAYALFAHCFTCSKDTRASVYLAAALAECGIAVLRFDFTGLGGSEGDFANTNFSSNVVDLFAAADFLRKNYRAPEMLIGHSLGGTAVLAAASEVPECAAVATIGSPFDPAHVLQQIPCKDEILREGEAEIDLAGRRFRIKRQLVEDLTAQKMEAIIGGLRKALLVMHSPRDTIVDIDNATRIFVAAKHPKSFVSLEPADHLLSHRKDARYAGHVLAAWAERYLQTRGIEPPQPLPGKVIVRETREGKFTQQVVMGKHSLHADEPVDAGGLDRGPGPYDLLLASLGACTSMTIRMYADLKGLPLQRVTVELQHEKIHAQDCADCNTREGKIDRIERLIDLEGDLVESQRAKLIEIANKCPVHRTLHSEVKISTRLKS
jgi:uncharacterized OsmC-like protein/fermentation-respiration switch protein FrsA (DUF1100 family)